jgi:hypothetical protein
VHLPDQERFHDFGERALKGKSQLVRVLGIDVRHATEAVRPKPEAQA